MRTCRHHYILFLFYSGFIFRRGKIILQEPKNNWKGWNDNFRGTSWHKLTYSGIPVFASCSPGSATEHWLLLPFIDNVPSSVKTLTVTFTFTFRKCISFKFSPVPCNEQVVLLRREENKPVRLSELRRKQFDGAATVTAKQEKMSIVPPVDVGPKSTFSGTVHKTGSKGIYLAIKNVASCFALFTFQVSYAGPCTSQGVNLMKLKETVAPESSSTEIEVIGSCEDNAVPTQGSSRLYAICHSSGEWTAGVNASCVCKQGYQQDIDQNKCEECPAGTYKDVAANTMCRACPENSKPGCLRDECVCKTGYYRVPVDQNETPCEALPPSPKLNVTTVISSTAAFISWFPAPRATRYSVECIMCSKAFTGYCYNCGRNVKFFPSKDSIAGTSVFISGLKPSTVFKFKVFSRNQVNEVVSKGKWNYLQVNLTTKSFG